METGASGIIAFPEAGEIFGEPALIGEGQRDEIAEVIEDSVIYGLGTSDYV